jgi:hypothetical protein
MKVFIGPYKSWIGPYQIAEALCFWARPHKDEHGFESKPEWVHDFGTWLSGGTAKDSILLKVCQWIESKRKRSTYIKIDKYDTWSMDSTLAFIILPMLKQLKATKHGGPFVDDADVPLPIRSTAPGARDRCENDWDTDEHHFTRWDYVLDEMIFAFNCKNDDSWQDKYHTGDHDIKFVPSAWDETGKPTMHEMIRGPRDTHQCDYEGMKKEQARITNGFQLFGKYYENLWD